MKVFDPVSIMVKINQERTRNNDDTIHIYNSADQRGRGRFFLAISPRKARETSTAIIEVLQICPEE